MLSEEAEKEEQMCWNQCGWRLTLTHKVCHKTKKYIFSAIFIVCLSVLFHSCFGLEKYTQIATLFLMSSMKVKYESNDRVWQVHSFFEFIRTRGLIGSEARSELVWTQNVLWGLHFVDREAFPALFKESQTQLS